MNKVTTILFNDRNASNDEIVLDYIENSEAIFFAGGDQGLYHRYWYDSPVQSLIQHKLINTTIGGTSAGLAILGHWCYEPFTLLPGAVSDEVMMDPYNINLLHAIKSEFLKIPFLESVIFDTHFVTKDRMGRMLTFMSRIIKESTASSTVVRGIGIDEATALLLDIYTGKVVAVGTGTAYICRSNEDLPASVCEPKTPLTFTHINCVRIKASIVDSSKREYSFDTWSSEGGATVDFVNDIINGTINANQYG